MPRKKINKTGEIKKVLEILERSGRDMSIREVKTKLELDYGIKRSPQIVKRYLLYLKIKEKIN